MVQKAVQKCRGECAVVVEDLRPVFVGAACRGVVYLLDTTAIMRKDDYSTHNFVFIFPLHVLERESISNLHSIKDCLHESQDS